MTSCDDLDTVFAALGSRHRQQIVHFLALQPASIQQLAGRIGISLTAIHRHIKVLEDAALVRRTKNGRVNFLARPDHRLGRKWRDIDEQVHVLYKGFVTPTPEIGRSWMEWLSRVGDSTADSGNPMAASR